MFYYYLRDNRYRCLDLTDSRTTTAVRATSNVGACPVVPPSLCGYRQGEPSPYLVSCVLLEELDFRSLVTLAANDQGPSTPVHRSYPPCRPVAIPLAGTVGSPVSLPCGHRGSGPYPQVKTGGITLIGPHLINSSTETSSGVSSRGITLVKITPVVLHYRADIECELQGITLSKSHLTRLDRVEPL